jgi:uncharacterized coiled-coil protein SlyX
MVVTHKELAAKLSDLERTVADQDGRIKALFQAVRQFMGTAGSEQTEERISS